jgi:hypothetical protein
VLQLIMYLLDADGDQFSSVASRVPNDLLYTQDATPHGTDFTHPATGFTGNWAPMTCEVDVIFKAASIALEVSGSDMYPTKPLDNKVITLIQPKVFTGADFGDFRGESRPSSRVASGTSGGGAGGGGGGGAGESLAMGSMDPFDRHGNGNGNASAASPSSHETVTPSEGKGVRFATDSRSVGARAGAAASAGVAMAEFSDEEDDKQESHTPTLTTPEISARRPNSSSSATSPRRQGQGQGQHKRGSGSGNGNSGSGGGRKSSGHTSLSRQGSNSSSKSRDALPSIIGLNEDKPKVPMDTLKALQGTEYRPKSPKYMVNIERSFSNS